MARSILLFAAVVLLGLVGLQWLRSDRPQAATSEEPTTLSVTVAPVEQRDLAVILTASGRVEAKASVAVKARLDGQVAEVSFTEGQTVHQGQVLLRMDAALLQAQERQAEGVVARDQSQLVKLQGDYQRNLALMGQGFISKSGLSQSNADQQSAQASLKADQASLAPACSFDIRASPRPWMEWRARCWCQWVAAPKPTTRPCW